MPALAAPAPGQESAPQKPEEKKAGDTAEKPPAPPQREQDYINVFVGARKEYLSARTAQSKVAARQHMQIRAHDVIGIDPIARGWVGFIMDITNTPDGDRQLTISIAPNVSLATWGNRYDDAQHGTLLKKYTPLYEALDNVMVGTPVLFDAVLIGARITDDESMVLRPEVITKFLALKPYP